jgi:hypothetical protein
MLTILALWAVISVPLGILIGKAIRKIDEAPPSQCQQPAADAQTLPETHEAVSRGPDRWQPAPLPVQVRPVEVRHQHDARPQATADMQTVGSAEFGTRDKTAAVEAQLTDD